MPSIDDLLEDLESSLAEVSDNVMAAKRAINSDPDLALDDLKSAAFEILDHTRGIAERISNL